MSLAVVLISIKFRRRKIARFPPYPKTPFNTPCDTTLDISQLNERIVTLTLLSTQTLK